jgi:hypothetical protein
MKKLQLLTIAMLIATTSFAQKSVRSMAPVNAKKAIDNLEFRQAEKDTLFYYDCSNILLIADDADYEAFELMIEDFDEAVPNPYAGETDADLLDYVSSFFWTYDRDANSIPTAPNGDATFDWDENMDSSVPDTAWYMTAYSWFTDVSAQADNYLGMGPVTIPDEGAEFKFHFRGVSNWIDGFDLYVTTGGMEPYTDVDPGETDIAYSLEGHTPLANAQDTIWTEHTVSLNDFAGESVYLTFHHHDTDMERLMLDNFLVLESDNMSINETELNGVSIFPNPSNGVFTVTSTEADVYTIKVMNVLGEVVSKKSIEGIVNETFNMSNYTAGLYFVKVSNATSENVQRIIIK